MTFKAQQKGKAFGSIVIIVHYQNPHRLLRSAGLIVGQRAQFRLRRFSLARQMHQKFGTAPGSLTVDFNAAAVHLDQPLYQRQSYS